MTQSLLVHLATTLTRYSNCEDLKFESQVLKQELLVCPPYLVGVPKLLQGDVHTL